MTLIKSKINSLAWLKSAIYVSVIGGGISSSFTPVLAATLVGGSGPTSVTVVVTETTFGNAGRDPLFYNDGRWKGSVYIEESNGVLFDSLVIRMYLQHISSPHPHQGESALGRQLNLNFRSNSSAANVFEWDDDVAAHPGINHFDLAKGVLTVNKFDRFIGGIKVGTGISSWDLVAGADHKVPEPTTMLGTALALGWGGWVKRKNSIKQNKTKSQG